MATTQDGSPLKGRKRPVTTALESAILAKDGARQAYIAASATVDLLRTMDASRGKPDSARRRPRPSKSAGS